MPISLDKTKPAASITDPSFMYLRADRTDILLTLQRHGYTPPDRSKQEQVRQALNQMN